jgi:ribosomal protein L11 methyltransferase
MWLQLSIDCNETEAHLLELVFEDLGALSVTLGDAGDQPLLEVPPQSTPLWQHTRVTALFEGNQDPHALRSSLASFLEPELLGRLQWERMEDKVWERVWLDYFKPMSFGRRLWVCPARESIDQPDAVVIKLDPGLAFGTGTHPTTALCLEWLDSESLAGKQIIDYGCGSGILAIAALKLGAASAVALDHDPQALIASRENAEKNGVSNQLITCLPDALPSGQFDLLIANILAGPLIQLAPEFSRLIRPGGRFALSGILTEQQPEVEAVYRDFASLAPIKRRQEWLMLSGTVT